MTRLDVITNVGRGEIIFTDAGPHISIVNHSPAWAKITGCEVIVSEKKNRNPKLMQLLRAEPDFVKVARLELYALPTGWANIAVVQVMRRDFNILDLEEKIHLHIAKFEL